MTTNINLDSVTKQIDSIVTELKQLDLSVSGSSPITDVSASSKVSPSEQLNNILNSISQALSQEIQA